jgi:hypothetical protein
VCRFAGSAREPLKRVRHGSAEWQKGQGEIAERLLKIAKFRVSKWLWRFEQGVFRPFRQALDGATAPAFSVQNKAHKNVLDLLRYCSFYRAVGRLVSLCEALQILESARGGAATKYFIMRTRENRESIVQGAKTVDRLKAVTVDSLDTVKKF